MIAVDLANKLSNSPLINVFVPPERIYFKRSIDSENSINDENLIIFDRKIETQPNSCVEATMWQLTIYSKSAMQLEEICEAIKETFRYNNQIFNNNHYYISNFVNRTDGVNKLTTGFYWAQITYDFSQIVG